MARRSLNISGIKQVIVFVTALLTACLGTVTSYGVQIMYTPSLTWMLGYGQDKARALAYRVAFISAFGGVLAALLRAPNLSKVIVYGFPLFIGGILGAIFAKPLAGRVGSPNQSRFFNTFGMLLMVAFLVQTLKQSAFAPGYQALGSPLLAHLLIGILVGIVSQLTGLVSNMMMIPGLYYFGGLKPQEAVVVALVTILIASLPIAWGYSKRGLYDGTYALPALLGGAIGSGVGGWLLVTFANHDPKLLLTLFALFSMFWCARELASTNPPASPNKPQTKIDL